LGCGAFASAQWTESERYYQVATTENDSWRETNCPAGYGSSASNARRELSHAAQDGESSLDLIAMMRYTAERCGSAKMEGKMSPELAKGAVFPGKIFKLRLTLPDWQI
jgi:hypothetical protein